MGSTKVMPSPADDATSIVALSAAYRHAIMNHLQVVSGWLHLGQPERAEEFIAELKENLQGETRLVKASKPPVAAVFLLRRGLAEACGIDLTFQLEGSPKDLGWPGEETGELIGAALDAAILILDNAQKGRALEVTVGEKEDCWEAQLRLTQAVIDEQAFTEEIIRAGLLRQPPVDCGPVVRRFEECGGIISCEQDGEAGIVRLNWPKEGSE